MYAAQAGSQDLTFDFATGLIHDNLLFVDRQTKSVWSQLDGKAVIGELTGSPLNPVPTLQTTWGYWRKLHPDTLAMIIPGETGVEYLYFDPAVGAARPRFAEFGHNPSVLGLGLEINGESLFLPWKRIRGSKQPIAVTVGGTPLSVHVNKRGLTAWALDAEGEMLPAVMTYRKSWLAFRPKSKIYKRR